MKNMWLFVGVTAVLLLTITGCIGTFDVGPTQTESQSIELGDADTAQATIKMGVGELSINGGAANLMDGEFTYNIEQWKPEVSYEIRRGEGQLEVSQPEVTDINGIPNNDINYKWDLRFANDVPMTMAVDLGAGKSDLVLGDIYLTDLNINVGVGETNIDLTGDWRESANINVKGGVGSTTLKLPQNVGVRVNTNTGLGSVDVYGLIRNGDVYTNDLYGQSDVELEISVSGGVGAIRIESE
ncbi:MAG: hypothetical protein H6659_12470 [Ardenticatenaceae bacterium]|nr:hypothetical protein [Ardenticatenaceae bacterium]